MCYNNDNKSVQEVTMKVIEFRLKVYVLQSISKESALEGISKLIDTCLIKEGLHRLHEENDLKFYNFGGFYPVEKLGVYEAGNIYTVTLRTVSEEIAKVFRKALSDQSNSLLKALALSERTLQQKPIEKIFTLTPILVKFNQEGYWKGNHTVEEFEQRLKIGLIKKYNKLNKTKLEEEFDWYNYLQFDNHKPIASRYKDIQLLGDKITLQISAQEEAQHLAWMAIGSGIGEMNARGFGFVNFRYV